jgi:hypothetical protein
LLFSGVKDAAVAVVAVDVDVVVADGTTFRRQLDLITFEEL